MCQSLITPPPHYTILSIHHFLNTSYSYPLPHSALHHTLFPIITVHVSKSDYTTTLIHHPLNTPLPQYILLLPLPPSALHHTLFPIHVSPRVKVRLQYHLNTPPLPNTTYSYPLPPPLSPIITVHVSKSDYTTISVYHHLNTPPLLYYIYTIHLPPTPPPPPTHTHYFLSMSVHVSKSDGIGEGRRCDMGPRLPSDDAPQAHQRCGSQSIDSVLHARAIPYIANIQVCSATYTYQTHTFPTSQIFRYVRQRTKHTF